MKHNSVASLIFHPATRCRRESDRRNPAHRGATTMRRTLSAIFIALSIVTAFAAFGVPVNTSWTYQGQLQRSGATYNGTCNFQFTLWDALSAGTQLGSTQAINSVNVANGLFTVVLDFDDFFRGDARWLGTSVQCSGDGGFTPLDPRQPLTAAPYALSLRPGATIGGFPAGGALNVSNNQGGSGVFGSGNPGVFGDGVGGNGVTGNSSGTQSAGVFGTNLTNTGVSGTGHIGVRGITTDDSLGMGVFGRGQGPNSAGVYGENGAGAAIWGFSTGVGPAILGQNSSTGLAGQFVGPVEITMNTIAPAIKATGLNGTGLAGRFIGSVSVEGTLSKSAGSFKIDHPLDPANKFLSHSFVESPDMKNIYDGNITTDATGSAVVNLPAYFEALNRDYRYQLTVLGQFAQAIVSREIAQNSFEIRTDKPGVKVSWQVTGIRQDAYARAHPIVPEEFKPAEEQGLYLFPAGFGAGEEKQIGAPSRPAPTQDAQCPTDANQSVRVPGK
jgi:hypothetical protein